ncbi:MAG: DUF4960 domain-containing protein, partial [Gammaproteobacteria bacterium]|nr:DUF4960 domain-containing protein [Gammaproteobacteria bacterium]NIW97947.1 DUF4960 domain-containing protein [Phycisphaerae bacterium]
GNQDNLSNLSPEEQEAYSWAQNSFDTDYLTFSNLQTHPALLNNLDALWWHYDESQALPGNAVLDTIKNVINNFVDSGGGLLLSGFATQYVVDLGIEDTPPQEIFQNPGTSSADGFFRKVSGHPIFEGFINPVVTLSAGLQVDNTTCWWNDPATFDGIWLADEVFQSGKIACGEYHQSSGKVLGIGSPAFDW